MELWYTVQGSGVRDEGLGFGVQDFYLGSDPI
jgi:hypothetical protein